MANSESKTDVISERAATNALIKYMYSSKATDYRISNLYVYKTEKVGGSDMLKIDYESYKLNISYMGPFISVIDSEEKLENKNPKWTLKDALFTIGNIDQKYMFLPKI